MLQPAIELIARGGVQSYVERWDDAVRMGPVAFGAERDRILAPRGNGRRWEGRPPDRAQGVWGGAIRREPIPVEPAPAAAVAVAEEVAVAAIGAPEPTEETPAPAEAVPLQSAPEFNGAVVTVMLEPYPEQRFNEIVQSIRSVIGSRPGPVRVALSVRGYGKALRLNEGVQWDERLAGALTAAAGVPIAVELRSEVDRA